MTIFSRQASKTVQRIQRNKKMTLDLQDFLNDNWDENAGPEFIYDLASAMSSYIDYDGRALYLCLDDIYLIELTDDVLYDLKRTKKTIWEMLEAGERVELVGGEVDVIVELDTRTPYVVFDFTVETPMNGFKLMNISAEAELDWDE